jgi:DMSO/TMAO reductase YedYZ molybdopterin-dependent catalytic subunit
LVAWAVVPRLGDAQGIAVQIDSGAPVSVSAADITGMPHQKISVEEHGKSVNFEGVPLRLVLEKAGVAFGDSLRGKRLASYLLVEAADGYRAIFALPELDPAFTDRVILLADRVDGHPLDNKEGPLRIVVPGEKRMARWVRQVTALKVVQVQ